MHFFKISLFLLLLLPGLSFANTLLILSSGLGMYGLDDTTNIAMEKFGANFIENSLKGNYRKIYKFEAYVHGKGFSAKTELLELLKKIVSERVEGEHLDVFSMQHGPDGLPFDGLSIEDVKEFIPYGFIQNVYATSCSEFGTFKASDNKNILVLNRNPEFSINLRAMGVKTYLYHANDNATGVFTLPLLVSYLREHPTDWAQAAKKTYEEFDHMTSELIPAFASLFSNQDLLKMMPSLQEGIEWESIFNSRIVIGSSANKEKQVVSMMKNRLEGNFEESMISMEPSLMATLKVYCPEGLSPYMSCKAGEEVIPLNKAFAKSLEHLQTLFAKYDPSKDSCLPGYVLNPLLSMIDINASVKELCLVKKSSSHFILRWKLKTEGFFRFRGTIKSDVEELRKITLAKRGSLHFRFNESKEYSSLNINGIKIFMNGFDGSGKYKEFSKIRLKGLKVYDNGLAQGRIRFLIFPVVAGIEQKNVEEVSMPDFIKVFGLKVWKNK